MSMFRSSPWRVLRSWLGLSCVCLAGAVAAQTSATAVRVWDTYTDQSKLLAQGTNLSPTTGPALALNIDVDPAQRFQQIVGFGASVTDASAWLMRHKLTEPQRQALLQELFGRGPNGLGFSLTRLSIGASDFSLHHYSLDDVGPGESDPSFAKFSLAPMRADVLPVLQQAKAINPQLQLIGSTWSAPAWMKSNHSLVQGSLRADAYGAFAGYLVKFADAMQAEGLPLFALTLQNEPHFEPKDYPGMRVDPKARAEVIGKHLGPLLAKRAQPVKILEWDHNWDEPQAPLAVLADPVARKYIDAVAWHCYAGDVGAQGQVHDAYPDKDVYFTECSGGEWKPHWRETFPWYMHNLIIGTTRHFAKGVLLWNLALDENHGPHLGGCSDCRGVVTIDSKTGHITRNFDYYALAHVSRFVRPGAVRVASTAQVQGLESVAFQNADDGSLVLVVLNSAEQEREFSVTLGGQRWTHKLPGTGAATLVWPQAR